MQRATIEGILQAKGQMIIDGSMSTALENMGANLNSKLWTAKVLAEEPELVKNVHINYFRAGADCGITCSYQATIKGLTENGYTEEQAEKIIEDSVKVFIEARNEWWESEGRDADRLWPLCLAGIGPYGAYLADGSEYTGIYSLSDEELDFFHRRRMEILWNAGADILLIETQPSLRESIIEAKIAEELGADYWISFSCRDEHRLNDGTPIADAVKAFSDGYPHLKMIGINCTKPEYIESLVKDIKAVTDIPVGVYPNSGDVYDPSTKTWKPRIDIMSFEDYALSYFRAGADAVGGCCTTVERHVINVVNAREKFINNR